ncbi:MAG TPA: hypothetical protein DCF99_11900 [Flavobacteriaceae bacterium]|nr:hypothetical protein [Flavobacteriaceae bacterium]
MNQWNIDTGKNKNKKLNNKKVTVRTTCLQCERENNKVHFVEDTSQFYWYHALYKSKYGIGGPNESKKPDCLCKKGYKTDYISE